MLGLGEPWRGAARARLRRAFWAGAGALLRVACSVSVFWAAEAVLLLMRVGSFSALELLSLARSTCPPRRHRHRCWNNKEALLAKREAYAIKRRRLSQNRPPRR